MMVLKRSFRIGVQFVVKLMFMSMCVIIADVTMAKQEEKLYSITASVGDGKMKSK